MSFFFTFCTADFYSREHGVLPRPCFRVGAHISPAVRKLIGDRSQPSLYSGYPGPKRCLLPRDNSFPGVRSKQDIKAQPSL